MFYISCTRPWPRIILLRILHFLKISQSELIQFKHLFSVGLFLASLDIEVVSQQLPSNPQKCTVVSLLYICMHKCDLLIHIVREALKNQELPNRQLPWGGNGEGIYKHLASENLACEASRLLARDRDGPHHACTYHTPCDSSRPYDMLPCTGKQIPPVHWCVQK